MYVNTKAEKELLIHSHSRAYSADISGLHEVSQFCRIIKTWFQSIQAWKTKKFIIGRPHDPFRGIIEMEVLERDLP
jgi:hypothetical protein